MTKQFNYKLFTLLNDFAPHPGILYFSKESGYYNFPEHIHKDFFEIVFQLEGNITHNINGQRINLSPGQGLIVAENDIHSLSGENVYFANLIVKMDFWQQSCSHLNLNLNFLSRTKNDSIKLFSFDNYREEVDDLLNTFCLNMDGSYSSLYLQKLLLFTLMELKLTDLNPIKKRDKIPEWFRNVCNFIDDHLESELNITELAKGIDISPEHFARCFRKYTGNTPTRYLNKKRVEMAKLLLLQSDKTISEIALECKFRDLPYFYRCFKKQFGISPGKIGSVKSS